MVWGLGLRVWGLGFRGDGVGLTARVGERLDLRQLRRGRLMKILAQGRLLGGRRQLGFRVYGFSRLGVPSGRGPYNEELGSPDFEKLPILPIY